MTQNNGSRTAKAPLIPGTIIGVRGDSFLVVEYSATGYWESMDCPMVTALPMGNYTDVKDLLMEAGLEAGSLHGCGFFIGDQWMVVADDTGCCDVVHALPAMYFPTTTDEESPLCVLGTVPTETWARFLEARKSFHSNMLDGNHLATWKKYEDALFLDTFFNPAYQVEIWEECRQKGLLPAGA